MEQNHPKFDDMLALTSLKEMQDSIKDANIQVEPRDTYKVAYIITFLLGAGNLLPWNAFITAIDYFGYLYPHRHVEKAFSVAYMSSSVLVLILMICGNWSRSTSFRLRMNIGFFMFVLSLMVAPVMDWAWYRNGSKEKGDKSYYALVASVLVCGLADGLIGGSLIGSAGKLPKHYMQAVFAGTASSGVLVSLLRITTKASLPQTPQGLRASAHLYFIVGSVILIICTVCCNLVHKLPVVKHHHELLQHESPCQRPNFWEVARVIRLPALGIFLIYTITLSIFPGYLAENVESKLLGDWYPIMLIVAYNVSDFLGKSVTAVYVLNNVEKATWACIARLLFYPLFAACLHGPLWLKSEVPIVLLTTLLGFTNGFLTSVLMILTPKTVPPSEAEVAAVVMAVFLGLGLVSGSVLGWFWII